MIAKRQQRQQQTQPMGETVNKSVIKGSCGFGKWTQSQIMWQQQDLEPD